jgi:hypothetical protein
MRGFRGISIEKTGLFFSAAPQTPRKIVLGAAQNAALAPRAIIQLLLIKGEKAVCQALA